MQPKMKKIFPWLYLIGSFILSFGLGLLFKDKYLLGSISLFLGCVQTYITTKGKWYEESIGIVRNLLSIAICIFAGMYGGAIFAVVVYIPLSVFSIVNWKKHEKNKVVELNKMTWAKSLITIMLVAVGTALVALLLLLIPGQNLAFWDACCNILNVCGILLIALRYKEGWIVWILCNFVEVVTWTLALVNGYSQNAIMMIIKNLFYICLNIWGFISFIQLRKKQEEQVTAPAEAQNL